MNANQYFTKSGYNTFVSVAVGWDRSLSVIKSKQKSKGKEIGWKGGREEESPHCLCDKSRQPHKLEGGNC